MKGLVVRWVINFLGFFAVAAVWRGLALAPSAARCLAGAALLAGLNACVKPGVFTFGIGKLHALQRSLSLGAVDVAALVVTTLLVNVVALPFLALISGGFRLVGPWAAVGAVLLLSLVSLCADFVSGDSG